MRYALRSFCMDVYVVLHIQRGYTAYIWIVMIWYEVVLSIIGVYNHLYSLSLSLSVKLK